LGSVISEEKDTGYARFNDSSSYSITVKGYDQIAASILKSNVQAVADMLTKNAEQIAELSRQTAPPADGRIDIYAQT
jgi:hypothetical protein